MANRDPEPESRHVQVSSEYTQITGKTADDVLKELEQVVITKEILVEELENKELEDEELEVALTSDIVKDSTTVTEEIAINIKNEDYNE